MNEKNKLNDQELEAVSGGITEEQALKKAMKEAKLTKTDFHTVKTECDDGRYVFEIKLIQGGIEHEFEIDCLNGDILSYDRDYYD